MKRTSLLRIAAVTLGLLVLLGSGTGCSSWLGMVKKRLPPPEQVDGGSYLFRFSSPSAQVVQLCGNWEENNWCNGQGETGSYRIGEMSDPDGDGIWEVLVELKPGRYEYKYVIDEQNWKEDPNNPVRADDGYGGFNSVLIID